MRGTSRRLLALGLLIAAATGCRGDRCKDGDPSFQVDVALAAGVEGARVKRLVVQVDAAGLHREQVLDVGGKLDDGKTSFSVGVGAAGSKGFTAVVTVTARDAAGGVVATGRGTLNGWGNACNFFELALGGGGDGRVDLPDAAKDFHREGSASDQRRDNKPPDRTWEIVSPCTSCPAGWSAVVYSARIPSWTPVACPVGWTTFSTPVAMEGLTDPGCSACTCSAPAGRTCTATFECQHDPQCGSKGNCSGSDAIPGDGSCFDFGCDNACSYARVIASGPSGGTCTPAIGGKVAYSWGTAHDLCVPSGASGCHAGCLPPANYAGCIVQAGDMACPAGFARKSLFYSGVSDTRVCSTCACSSPTGGTCASSATLYACGGCLPLGGYLTVTIGACASASSVTCGSGPTIRAARYAGVASPGQCAPSGGVKSGAVTPTGPVTVCCP